MLCTLTTSDSSISARAALHCCSTPTGLHPQLLTTVLSTLRCSPPGALQPLLLFTHSCTLPTGVVFSTTLSCSPPTGALHQPLGPTKRHFHIQLCTQCFQQLCFRNQFMRCNKSNSYCNSSLVVAIFVPSRDVRCTSQRQMHVTTSESSGIIVRDTFSSTHLIILAFIYNE